MTPLADSLGAVAARLIARYGQEMNLSKPDAARYDPETGIVDAPETALAVNGIVESLSAAFVGGLVQSGDLLVTVAGPGLAETPPAPGDRLLIDGTAHDIVDVASVAAGRQPVLFRLVARR